MRKILTSSMIAGAALLVAACGGTDTAANNTADTNMGEDTMMDANADQGMDTTNMSMDANATSTDANAADANATTETNAQ